MGLCPARHREARVNVGMRRIGLAVIVLVAVGAAWSGLWFFAQREAGRRIDAWIDAEATQGRMWTCPGRTITGYPLALVVTCRQPVFVGQALGQGVRGSLAGLTAAASLLHPRSLALDLTSPFTYRTADARVDVTGAWSALHSTLFGLPAIRALALRGSDVGVEGRFGGDDREGGHAAAIDATFTLATGGVDPTLDFTVTVGAVAVPPLDALLGGATPADVALSGRLDQARTEDARSPEELMERWRLAGGHVDLASSHLTRGGSQVSATGSLRLDDAHRPQGRLDARFVGMEPILAHYGISGNLAGVGSLLGSLFGGHAHEPTEPGTLALPINLTNGRVAVGPIRTPIPLPPLY